MDLSKLMKEMISLHNMHNQPIEDMSNHHSTIPSTRQHRLRAVCKRSKIVTMRILTIERLSIQFNRQTTQAEGDIVNIAIIIMDHHTKMYLISSQEGQCHLHRTLTEGHLKCSHHSQSITSRTLVVYLTRDNRNMTNSTNSRLHRICQSHFHRSQGQDVFKKSKSNMTINLRKEKFSSRDEHSLLNSNSPVRAITINSKSMTTMYQVK